MLGLFPQKLPPPVQGLLDCPDIVLKNDPPGDQIKEALNAIAVCSGPCQHVVEVGRQRSLAPRLNMQPIEYFPHRDACVWIAMDCVSK